MKHVPLFFLLNCSVVTSVSVILNADRHNKEMSLEVTTAHPPSSDPSDAETTDVHSSSAYYTAEASPPDTATTLPSTSTIRVPSPVYLHLQSAQVNDDTAAESLDDPPETPISSLPAVPLEPVPAEDAHQSTNYPSPAARQYSSSTLPPFFPMKSSRRADDDGIRVIDALKDIVRQAQQQHKQDAPIPAPIAVTLTESGAKGNGLAFGGLPPGPMPVHDEASSHKIMPGTGLNGDDDDEMEVEVNGGALGTTDAIDDFAKVVVMVQPEESEGETDTAPSAEVQHNYRMYKSDIIDELTASILCQQRADIEECGLDLLVLK